MHSFAYQWDILHNVRGNPHFIPHGRPCDRCGEPVPEGFIHDQCLREELKEGYREQGHDL